MLIESVHGHVMRLAKIVSRAAGGEFVDNLSEPAYRGAGDGRTGSGRWARLVGVSPIADAPLMAALLAARRHR